MNLRARAYVAKELLFKGKSSLLQVWSSVGGDGRMSSNNLLRAYAYMPWLRAALGKIGDGIGATPWYLEQVATKAGPTRNVTYQNATLERKAVLKRVMASDKSITSVNAITSHPMLDVLSAPNPFMTGDSMIALTALHIDLVGEALWWLRPGENGVIEQIWPVPPGWISKRPSGTEAFFELNTSVGIPKKLSIDEVVWFRTPAPDNPYSKTVGVAGPLADELETDEWATKHVKAFFKNGARPDILISGTGLTKEEADRAEERWLQKLQGFWRAHRPHFIGAEVKVTQLNGKFNDLQMVDLRKWQRDVVFQTIGVPPEMLGVLESSNRATINTATFIFGKWVLTPRLEVIRATIQTQLVPHFDTSLVVMYVSPVEEDREFRLEVYKASPWAHTVNDWRNLANDDPFADETNGEYLMIPAAYVPTRYDDLENYVSPYTAGQPGRPANEDDGGDQ